MAGMHHPFYPMFVSLEGRVCLVVGGGAVGERKVRKLLECGASVRIAAADLTPWLREFVCRQGGGMVFLGREYDASQMEGVSLVFAATSDPALNRSIAADAHRRGIWCNTATNPEEGSFSVPAVHRQGPIAIAIVTDGLSPAAARRIRQKLEQEIGPEWGVYICFLGLMRTAVQDKKLGTEANQCIFREIANLPILEQIQNSMPPMYEEISSNAPRDPSSAATAIIEAVRAVHGMPLSREEIASMWDKAWKQSFSS